MIFHFSLRWLDSMEWKLFHRNLSWLLIFNNYHHKLMFSSSCWKVCQPSKQFFTIRVDFLWYYFQCQRYYNTLIFVIKSSIFVVKLLLGPIMTPDCVWQDFLIEKNCYVHDYSYIFCIIFYGNMLCWSSVVLHLKCIVQYLDWVVNSV